MSCTLPTSAKGIAGFSLRISFGAALFLVGVAHYLSMDVFAGMVSSGLGPLEPLGTLWAYVLPALQIIGGGLIVMGKQPIAATWCTGVALGSIVIGMLLKPVIGGATLPDVMGAAQNGLLWLVAFVVVLHTCCCKKEQ